MQVLKAGVTALDLINKKQGFHTLKGYEILDNKSITNAMEDYLEMILRLSEKDGAVRISQLAAGLNVKPSSASKMADNLKSHGLIDFEKYGSIKLTLKGEQLAKYLIHRHSILNQLLCAINQSEDELEQVEKIEHYLSPKTILNIENFLKKQNLWVE